MNSFLVSATTLKKRGFVNSNVPESMIAVTLTRVQDTMLHTIIGKKLFQRLSDGVKNNDLTVAEVELMDDYIIPYLIASVDYRIGIHLSMEIRASGVVKSLDQQAQVVSKSEQVYADDNLRHDVDTYRRMLIKFLRNGGNTYPQWSERCLCDEYREKTIGFDKPIFFR